MAEKISTILYRIMLCIFIAIFGVAILFGVFLDLEHKSYVVAFAMALLVLAAYWVFSKRLKNRQFVCDKLNPVKVGAILTLVCFAINLLYILLVRFEPTVDFYTFWNTAAQLSRGEPISAQRYVAVFPHILGYSAFLSVFMRLFGTSPMVAAIVNVVLTTVSAIVIYILCLRWRGVRAACFASLLWTVCPSKMMYNSMVLSDPYYSCLILIFVFIVEETDRKFSSSSWLHYGIAAVVAGLCLGAANTARPIAAVPIIAFFIWLLFLRGDKLKVRALWKKWAVFSVVFLAVYSLYGNIWNRYAENTVGEEIPSIPGYNIYVGFNTEYWGSYSPADMDLLVKYLYDDGLSAVDLQAKMLEHAKERISSGEIDFGYLFMQKLRTFLGCDEGGAYYSKEFISPTLYSLTAIISNIWYYCLALFVLLAAVKLIKNFGDSVFGMMPMYVIGLTLAQMLVEVAGRYHYSIIPMLIIISASAIDNKTNSEKEVNCETETVHCDTLL